MRFAPCTNRDDGSPGDRGLVRHPRAGVALCGLAVAALAGAAATAFAAPPERAFPRAPKAAPTTPFATQTVTPAAKPAPAPQPRPESGPGTAKVATGAAPTVSRKSGPPTVHMGEAADASHHRIVQLPEGAHIAFGPLKDVRMPTLMARQLVLPAHSENAKPAQGTMQVDCAIDASGVPQDCKLLSASHSGGASESILSWLTSGAIRYPAKDANGQTGGRRVLTVKFPGQ